MGSKWRAALAVGYAGAFVGLLALAVGFAWPTVRVRLALVPGVDWPKLPIRLAVTPSSLRRYRKFGSPKP